VRLRPRRVAQFAGKRKAVDGWEDRAYTSSTPRLRPGVTFIPLEDEAVLYEEEGGVLHQLNPTATLVCRLIDGSITVAQVIDDLSFAFEAEHDVVADDVLGLVRSLDERGLLSGLVYEVSVDERRTSDGD
jgi:hypothetical protein